MAFLLLCIGISHMKTCSLKYRIVNCGAASEGASGPCLDLLHVIQQPLAPRLPQAIAKKSLILEPSLITCILPRAPPCQFVAPGAG